MPLTLSDVLNTLNDPVAMDIDFHVGKVHINAERLTTVRDHIRVGNILVKGGTSDLAFYDQASDVLITQKKSPPANDDDRALLLHECVHAMIDVYDPNTTVTRHIGELAAYLTQVTYTVRKDPSRNPGGTGLWDKFWIDLYATVRANKLDTSAGNGATIDAQTLEKLRKQLAALPSVNYGSFSEHATDVSDGLSRMNLFFTSEEPIYVRQTATANEVYPDPPDHYLIKTLLEKYASNDVRGYGARLRSLRRDFLYCSHKRAMELKSRLSKRTKGDQVSELFYDRMSSGGRALLLRVLALRT